MPSIPTRLTELPPQAAAATLEMSASQARIFDQDERLVVSRAIIKAGIQGWTPIAPQSSVLRTCVLELPRDHATIKCSMSLVDHAPLKVSLLIRGR